MIAAHPRAGGENFFTFSLLFPLWGSSPRGRGKPPPHAHRGGLAGLIPARAGKTTSNARDSRNCTAHPRAGGENWTSGGGVPTGVGSSPRGRGKRVDEQAGDVCPGLIPARAGKTLAVVERADDARAHPRAGGENTTKKRSTPIKTGSSPRGRGKRGRTRRSFPRRRLIPARAGKTRTDRRADTARKAHPRAGGENAGHLVVSYEPRGSSPRGRGKLTKQRKDHYG